MTVFCLQRHLANDVTQQNKMEITEKYAIFILFSCIGFGCFSPQIFKDEHRLNKYINYYVPLRHQRVKLQRGQRTKFYFRAFDIDFNVELFLGSLILDSKAKVSVKSYNESEIILRNNANKKVVHGHVNGVRDSNVFGRVCDDVFYGIIRFPNETYYIEPAKYFFQRETSFISVIYRFSDVNLTRRHFGDLVFNTKPRVLPRQKRDLNGNIFKSIKNSDRTICTLRVTVDHKYYELFTSRSYDDIITSTVVILDAVNDVFKKTDFDMDGKADGIGFKIKDFVIWWSITEPGYGLSADTENLFEYLNTFTSSDSSDVCLSLLITGRDFSAVYGAAYQRGKEDGGICSTKRNKAVVSLYLDDWDNYVQVQPYIVSFAEHLIIHEIGHSFGAGHDDSFHSAECVPEMKDGGPYVMISQAYALKTKNSHRFSPCSRREIGKVFEQHGIECFLYDTKIESCGNGFVDSLHEECDCGQKDQCNTIDACCAPPGGYLGDEGCTYRRNSSAVCSFREDKCCTATCNIVPKDDKLHCNKDEICQVASYCDGISQECQRIGDLPDGTLCRGGLGECLRGICVDIVCRNYNMETCSCGFHYDTCELCCSLNDKCTTARIWGILNVTGRAFVLPDGEHCAGGLGVCQNGLCWLFNKTKSLEPFEGRKVTGLLITPPSMAAEPMSAGKIFLIVLAVNFVPAFLVVVIVVFCIKHRRSRDTEYYAHQTPPLPYIFRIPVIRSRRQSVN